MKVSNLLALYPSPPLTESSSCTIALIQDQDDEVLFAIAEELGQVWQLNNDKTIFLPLLESLAKSDETVVREQATKSL